MAIRNIRIIGDEILEKKCRPVTEMKPRIKELIEDMLDTMYDAQGVGLAAPQVGVLKRIVVIDVTPEGDDPIVLINPEIIELAGEQEGQEGGNGQQGNPGVNTQNCRLPPGSHGDNLIVRGQAVHHIGIRVGVERFLHSFLERVQQSAVVFNDDGVFDLT